MQVNLPTGRQRPLVEHEERRRHHVVRQLFRKGVSQLRDQISCELRLQRIIGILAPRTPVEQTLASIWSELLGLARVGIHDNFFESGGHSLLATQLISRVREKFQVEVALRQLFERPTIESFATVIAEAQQIRPELQTPAIVPIARQAHRIKRSAVVSHKEAQKTHKE